jgi:hypothetical protein
MSDLDKPAIDYTLQTLANLKEAGPPVSRGELLVWIAALMEGQVRLSSAVLAARRGDDDRFFAEIGKATEVTGRLIAMSAEAATKIEAAAQAKTSAEEAKTSASQAETAATNAKNSGGA